MRQPQGKPSQPLHSERTEETWACSACGRKTQIRVPAKRPQYTHTACKGFYRPEPGREETP